MKNLEKKIQSLEQAPTGAEDVEILRIVGAYRHVRHHKLVWLRSSQVRETLTEDLVERLVVDLLEITESLQGMDCLVLCASMTVAQPRLWLYRRGRKHDGHNYENGRSSPWPWTWSPGQVELW